MNAVWIPKTWIGITELITFIMKAADVVKDVTSIAHDARRYVQYSRSPR
jgi:hypothetical protein